MRQFLVFVCLAALLLPGCQSWSADDVAKFWDSVDRGSAVAKEHGLRMDAEFAVRERTHFGLFEAVVIESPVTAKIRAWLDPAIAKETPATQPVEK